MKTHLATVHERKKKNQCTHCDESFSLKSLLKSHIKAQHIGSNKKARKSKRNIVEAELVPGPDMQSVVKKNLIFSH